MSTGWNFQPNGKCVQGKKREELNYINIFDKGGIPNLKKKNGHFSNGLNCGPAGRKALIRWIEYNYQLKNEEENSYPALSACKVWQRRQSFQDKTLSGLVDFLKFLSIPKHVTYRTVFDNYLSPKFVNRLNSTESSQKGLTKLAKKMMPMFQVREMQPLFSIVLDKIEVIPIGILKILVEETPSAQYFYSITSTNVKRKIWVLCPHKFYQEIEPIIDEIILRIKIKSKHDDTVVALINQIVQLIGNQKEQNFLYNLCVHIVRLKWVQVIISEREDVASDCSGVSNGTSPPGRGRGARSDDEDSKLEYKAHSAPVPSEMNDFVEDANLKSENKENWDNFCYVNLDPVSNSYLDGNHIGERLKKLHSCFEKIMNKEQNIKEEKVNNSDWRKPYVICLNGYSHYSTSFHYLKKRRIVQVENHVYNSPEGEGKIPWKNCEKDTGRFSRSIMEPGADSCGEFKNDMKRSLPIGQEGKDAKRVKMDTHIFKNDKIAPHGSNLSSGKMNSEVGDNATVVEFKGKDEDGVRPISGVNTDSTKGDTNLITNNGRNSHSSKSSNDRVRDEDEVDSKNKGKQKKKGTHKMKYKANCSENYPNKKTLLPFDGMFYSHLRLLICLQYKEKYNIKDEEMVKVDRYFPVIEFINHVIRDGILNFSDQVKTQDVVKRIKNSLNVKNVEDLCEYSLLFSNILLKFCIIKGICFYFYRNNLEVVPYKNCMLFWTSLFYFGVYNHFFSLIKYALDKVEYKDRKKRFSSQYFHLRQKLLGQGIPSCGNFTEETFQTGAAESDSWVSWDEKREGPSEGESGGSDEVSAESSDGVLHEEVKQANITWKNYKKCGRSRVCAYYNEVDEDECSEKGETVGSSEGSDNVGSIEEGQEGGSSNVSEGVGRTEQSEELEGTAPSEEIEVTGVSEEVEVTGVSEEVPVTAPSEEIDMTLPSEEIEMTLPSEDIDGTVLREEVDQTEQSSPAEGPNPDYAQEYGASREGYNSSVEYQGEQFITNENERYDDVCEYQDHLERYNESEVREGESSKERKRREQEREYSRYREYEYGEQGEDEQYGEEDENEEKDEDDGSEEYGADDDDSLSDGEEETDNRGYERYAHGARKGKTRVRQFKTCSDNTWQAHQRERRKKDNFKLYFYSMRNTQEPNKEYNRNVRHTMGQMKRKKNYKLLVSNCNDSCLKIPLMSILKYIVIANNEQSTFLSFFDFFEGDSKFESLESVKEKKSILLLSALLNIPQVNYMKIKNFFSIIHEFFYMEKKNLPSLSLCSAASREGNSNAEVAYEVRRLEEHKKSHTSRELLSNTNVYSDDTGKVRGVGTNLMCTSSNGVNGYANWGSSKRNTEKEVTITSGLPLHISNEYGTLYEKDRRVNEWSEDQTSVSDTGSTINVAVGAREKNTFESLRKRLISQINDMNSTICGNYFLINNNITSICAYLREMGGVDCDGSGHGLVNPLSQVDVDNATNVAIGAKGSNVNKELSLVRDLPAGRNEQNISTPPSISLFTDISKEIVSKLNNCNRVSIINNCLPYILKVCSRTLHFLKKKKLINIYIKYMYLYEYLYHMVLNRMLHISTMKSLPFLQNVILKELHYYFEDFKNRKVKNLWKFYLYARTLIDINKMNIINKLFHSNAIDYFIKLFYSLSFYNPVFSVLFLKLMQTPLFYRNIENKKSEILQNIWIGTHERSFSGNSEHNRQCIEYKIWIEAYNKFFTK
ncbi:hypothetical protein AK88_03451 [Plasmodium fragile]|uniref:Uncharacterized protein n=1 Tax=Plasmodium fragile TaxID=5857 RepID=A0A0D9QJE9_PLAFR|nr:uncharacterized protein AK88_03451 [Plasmodium fragile]KJP86942.1 hypothetical protein AK88_03451 [Plasmodium fragile]